MQAKLPIPRMKPERRGSVAKRVKRACEACREQRIKCDGARPVCSQCRVKGLENCLYLESKAVRQQEALGSMQTEIESYRSLLGEIHQGLQGSMADRVAKALKNTPTQRNEYFKSTQNFSITPSNLTGDVDEDFNRSEKSRATGYIGSNSEISWMQHLNSQASKRNNEEITYTNPQFQFPIDDSIASMNYHLDYQRISKPDMTTPFALPPKSLADILFQVYLEKAHTSFPVIRPDLFHDQINCCYSEKRNPGSKWLAVFNIVLAIACALGRLSAQKLPHEADEDLFSARARALGISGQFLYDHCDLQQVQAEALMALNFLILSHINRSWKMIGIAARSGIALGLNIDQRTAILDVKSQEARKQLWWSIFRLENILSVMTGRVSCLGNASVSVSPPFLSSNLSMNLPDIAQPINQLQWTIQMDESKLDSQGIFLRTLVPTESLYFFYMVDLSLIIHYIIDDINTTNYTRLGWNQVKSSVLTFSQKVDYWASTIHPSFGFQYGRIQHIPERSPAQFSLALNYYSARILLNRPCLNGPAFGKRSGPYETGVRFADTSAFDCLHASLAIIALLPNQPELAWIYQVPQWWDLLHILTQATVVLLLGLLSGPLPSALETAAPISDPTAANSVWASVKKGLSWLDCLGETSEAARRAFHFLKSIIHRIISSEGLGQEVIPLAIEISRTSSDPKFPWLRDSSETSLTSSCQESTAINSHYSEPGRCPSDTGKDCRQFQVSQEEHQPIVPIASTILDTEQELPSPVSSHHSAIEDVLISLLNFNA